ncbi:Cas4 family exonuclease [Microbacterium phage Mazun]|nr:Cas4 family exonuclease [Microbacterium phage Mazun]
MTWDLTPRPTKCPGVKYACGRNKLEGYPFCYAHIELLKREGVMTTTEQEPMRMSASYVTRYNNCHGSANLVEAIPGFQHPLRNNDGMKGEGTRLHKIFELAVISGRLREAATLLVQISDLWGPKRTAYLEQSEVAYLTSYFLTHKKPPPLELPDLKTALLEYKPVKDTDGNAKRNEDGTVTLVASGVAPRRIQFIAEALNYVQDIIDRMDAETLTVKVEVKKEVAWLETKPKTTVDLILADKNEMHVIDLKAGDIEVSPIMNEQLMYYAETFDAGDYDKVTLHIIQRGYTDEWVLTTDVREKWVAEVQESERAILAGDLALSPGAHCKFCPANPHGRGDRGSKSCPVMMTVLYGESMREEDDNNVLEDDDE